MIEGRGERRRFTRTVVLPEEIDADKIDARVENGLLTLTLPVIAKMQPRRIEVRVGGQQMKSVGTVPSVSGETKVSDTRVPQETR